VPTLRDGSETRDPRLDRLIQYDERSRAFRSVEGIEDKPLRSYTWNKKVWLDQGSEGACVGFSIAHELAARPVVVPNVTPELATFIYKEAQKVDPWEGEDYSGTSVLAGAQVAKSLGYFDEYRWAFGEEDLARTIGYRGPCVLGIRWYQGMFNTDGKGYVHPTGGVMGGHAILCDSFNLKLNRYRLSNSWGKDWGMSGYCYVTREDMALLLEQDGEAMIPLKRRHADG
jgi:hypothetical protein